MIPERYAPATYALFRIVFGFLFLCFGLQKVFGWFGGQQAALMSLGWSVKPSQLPFFLATPAGGDVPVLLAGLRAHGIKLRDATGFGLAGQVRLRVHQPAAQAALIDALGHLLPHAAQAVRRHAGGGR